MKALVLTLLALILSACASWQQGINAYEAAGLVAVKAADDNAVHVWATAGCAFPLSAILRNQEVIPAIKALCTPSSGVGQVLP